MRMNTLMEKKSNQMNYREKKEVKPSKGAQKLKEILASKHAETMEFKEVKKKVQPQKKKKRHPQNPGCQKV